MVLGFLTFVVRTAVTVVSVISQWRSWRGQKALEANPAMSAIEEQLRRQTEEERAKARRAEEDAAAAKRARERAEQDARYRAQEADDARDAQRRAEERRANADANAKREAEKARLAEQQAKSAEEDRLRRQRRAEEDTAAANRARERAEQDARDRDREAGMARDAQRRAEEGRANADANAKREAEKAKLAEQEAKRAEGDRLKAEAMAKEAEEGERKAKARQNEAERKWKEGIQPVVWPTRAEFESVKRSRRYTEGLFHFAIAGISGSGKSSLINAFRGLRDRDRGAARTGIVETTADVSRYPDPDHEIPFVWYDIPGAGTLAIRDWEYFNQQGLYIFDCIIVLFDNRFTATDIAILKNCRRFNIPAYIVRSKSEVQIQNVLKTLDEYDSDDEDDSPGRIKLWETAFEKYVAETRRSVQMNLEKAELPPQPVYLISRDTLLAIIKEKPLKKKPVIDEYKLLEVLESEARSRRGRAPVNAEASFSNQFQ